jgi:hypothetical protein
MLAAALLAWADLSDAAVKVSAVRTGNWLTTTPGVLVPVPLNNAGATQLTFNNGTAGKRYVLTYSAECAVGAPPGNRSAAVELVIFVNGALASPGLKLGGDAFCSSGGTGLPVDWIRSSITIAITAQVGANTVEVKAYPTTDASVVSLGDSALVVHD